MLAEKEEEMRSMMERLEGYLERKKLELNAGKIKIVRFRKGEVEWQRRNGNGKAKR